MFEFVCYGFIRRDSSRFGPESKLKTYNVLRRRCFMTEGNAGFSVCWFVPRLLCDAGPHRLKSVLLAFLVRLGLT